ncbi:GNAT family N-acetyltransferase [Bdellovibrio sp. KM01]|uniref:GNAT family N-acetyltransferase n=1 Tax=Bdellovibrio sp. KM01 TaxID=2748865 RepID=UPI0015E99A08|nr:GNAT family N-acetyltransferase [Bdellovibrio sp. KM01]QLY26569.1 GNAT family N-acetyltransferase [Bdellovibrio sp. KM01]
MTIDNFKILTARLELRPHRPDDVDFMVELNSDPEITRYVPDGPIDAAQASNLIASIRSQFLDRRIGRFVVIEKHSRKKLGWCGLKWLEDIQQIDLGYRFMKSSWGKGYASEAAQACLDYGFNTLKFKKIIAQIMPANTASIALAQRLGMKEVNRVTEDGQEFLVFEMQATDFR